MTAAQPSDNAVIDQMMDAIRVSRQFAHAVGIGVTHLGRDGSHKLPDTARFYLTLALACRLADNSSLAHNYINMATRCSDYSPVLAGDFLYNEATARLRENLPDIRPVQQCIERAQQAYESAFASGSESESDHRNRVAKIEMIKGRIALASGNTDAALTRLRAAEGLWESLGDQADQRPLYDCRVSIAAALRQQAADAQAR